jgi:DNA-binding transcriptional MocR family regulator
VGSSSREIAVSIERGVTSGQLHAEERLPPIRELAAQLRVSPATVAAAYRMLRERGLVLGKGRRGTAISSRPPLAVPAPVPIPAGVRDLRVANPDLRLLPDLKPVLASIEVGDGVTRRGGTNDLMLLELARNQFAADGLDPRHVAVVGGALDGIERALATHVTRGDLVAVEDPAYPPILDLLTAVGATPVPVAVDDDGLCPDSLRAAVAQRPTALVVVPRAQNPTGAAMTAERAADLQVLLEGHDQLMVIEDDYAHEIAGVPFETLTPRCERWCVIRSASKSLSPDLRLAVVAGDETTIGRLEGRQTLGTGWVSTILQSTVARLWSDPRTAELIARAREAYDARREALVSELVAHGIPAQGRSGLNVWASVRDEAATVQSLLGKGWAVQAGERFRIRSSPGIRITISTLGLDEAPGLAAAVAATQDPKSTPVRMY